MSKAVDGKPVKVTWMRDDDLMNTYFHTVSVEHLEAGLDAQGRTVAWLHRSVAPTIFSTFVEGAKTRRRSSWAWASSTCPSRFRRPHRKPGSRRAHPHRLVPIGLQHPARLRGAVVRGRAGRRGRRDPKDYLLEIIGPARQVSPEALGDTWNHGESPALYPVDTSRLRRVVETVAREARWGRPMPKGRGRHRGHYSSVSYVAAVVEVAVAGGHADHPPRGHRGGLRRDLNPARVRAQMEGAAVMGVSVATVSEMSFKNGRAQQDDFHTYELTRMAGAPRDHPGAHRSRRGLRQAHGRCGRAGAAGAAGPVQRDLRGHRQADPPAADPGPAQGLSTLST